jgi:hypothetical protein
MEQFDLEFRAEKSPKEILRECLAVWTGQLADNGYALTSQSDVGVSYSRKYWRWYIIALAVFLFPIGLLFLLVRDEATITATISHENGESVLVVNGTAPTNVREAFEDLEI